MSISSDYTTNKTLEAEARRLKIPLHFCWFKSSFSKPRKNGAYIINLASETPGTHWVALWKEGKQYSWFDPFGMPPPNEVLQYLPNTYLYNESVIQDPASGGCGSYSLEFLQFMNENTNLSLKERFQHFLNLFSYRYWQNRNRLHKLEQD